MKTIMYKSNKIFLCVISALWLLTSADAYTFKFWSCWGNPIKWRNADMPVQFRASAVSFPEGHTYSKAFEVTLERWYDNPSAAYFEPKLIYNDNYVSIANGESEIWFTKIKKTNANAYSRIYCTPNKHYIYASDIRFNSESLSELYSGNNKNKLAIYKFWVGGETNFFHFRAIAVHELGHALGLAHEDRWYNVMGSTLFYQTNGDLAKAYVDEDASDGTVFLYGAVNAAIWNNLIVSHFKYGGSSVDTGDVAGNYSTHSFTTIYNNNKPFLADEYSGIETNFDHPFFPYILKKGKTYQVEFTYKNARLKNLTGVDIGFYLSKDDNITPSDQLIKTGKLNLTRNAPETVKTNIFIPYSLPLGDYYLGVIIDHNNKIPEINKKDNATYLPFRIYVPVETN